MFKRILAASAAAALVCSGALALVAAAPASAGAACTNAGPYHNFFTGMTAPFYLAAPNKVHTGSAAELKLNGGNGTTQFLHCNTPAGQRFAFVYTPAGSTAHFVLTTRDFYAGGLVTFEPLPAGGPYASQMWTWSAVNPGQYSFQNVKTGLYLRVRNSGPVNYQTVSTGHSLTAWDQSS